MQCFNPPECVITLLFLQPIYEPQNFRMRETTPTSDTSQSSDLASIPDKGRQQQGMSQLSSNLSELDQLLQDLNSAQFLSEVEKKSTGGESTYLAFFPP